MRIGVVGYSAQKFDKDKAFNFLEELLDEVALEFGNSYGNVEKFGNPFGDIEEVYGGLVIVSGLTNIGIPALAYERAEELNFQTMGIACAKAKDYECYPCDRVHIIGENWGDESEAFLASIDALIRIGGGKQSLMEVHVAKERGIPVFERDLEAIA